MSRLPTPSFILLHSHTVIFLSFKKGLMEYSQIRENCELLQEIRCQRDYEYYLHDHILIYFTKCLWDVVYRRLNFSEAYESHLLSRNEQTTHFKMS